MDRLSQEWSYQGRYYRPGLTGSPPEASILEDGSCPNISINGFTLNSSKSTMFNVFGNAEPTSVLDNVYETYTYTINGASHTYTIELVNDASTNIIKEMTLTSN